MLRPTPFGKFLLLDRINVGGMAEVFSAKAFGDDGETKILAIKKILPALVEDEEFITMFLDEARIAVQLNHRNVVPIFELGKHQESYFIAMEYLPGRDLRVLLDRAKKRREPLPLGQSLHAAAELAVGLDYAHRATDAQGRELHIVHRDVSPQNILIGYDGRIKLIDFGIAKAATKSQRTQAGILKGKFGYMSPEQVRGLPVDRRSDLFGLGVILYELITGERAFTGESDFSVLERVRNAEVVPPRKLDPRIPEPLERLVLRALAREPEARYQWGSELAKDLLAFLDERQIAHGQPLLAAYMAHSFAEEILHERERMLRFGSIDRPPEVPAIALRPFQSTPPDRRLASSAESDRTLMMLSPEPETAAAPEVAPLPPGVPGGSLGSATAPPAVQALAESGAPPIRGAPQAPLVGALPTNGAPDATAPDVAPEVQPMRDGPQRRDLASAPPLWRAGGPPILDRMGPPPRLDYASPSEAATTDKAQLGLGSATPSTFVAGRSPASRSPRLPPGPSLRSVPRAAAVLGQRGRGRRSMLVLLAVVGLGLAGALLWEQIAARMKATSAPLRAARPQSAAVPAPAPPAPEAAPAPPAAPAPAAAPAAAPAPARPLRDPR